VGAPPASMIAPAWLKRIPLRAALPPMKAISGW
jgi:hypothetical protein